MSRKTNGYRLGESIWWLSRTPPSFELDHKLIMIENIIKGMYDKFGFLTDNLIVQRKYNNTGNIIILGTKRRKKRYSIPYLIYWIKELLQVYYKLNINFSFREVPGISAVLTSYISKNEQPILKVIRQVHKKIKKEMKVFVIGSDIKAEIIQGTIKTGQKVVIRHKGKVEKAIVVRTKRYNFSLVSYDVNTVMIIGNSSRVKGPISKGLKDEIKALSQQQI